MIKRHLTKFQSTRVAKTSTNTNVSMMGETFISIHEVAKRPRPG